MPARQISIQKCLMQWLDEKTCSICAERIKASALVCHFCGHKFTPEDLSAELQRLNSLRTEFPNELGDYLYRVERDKTVSAIDRNGNPSNFRDWRSFWDASQTRLAGRSSPPLPRTQKPVAVVAGNRPSLAKITREPMSKLKIGLLVGVSVAAWIGVAAWIHRNDPPAPQHNEVEHVGDTGRVKYNVLGCYGRDDAYRYTQLTRDREVQAMAKFELLYTRNGACQMLIGGTTVKLAEVAFSDEWCYRPIGEPRCLWTNRGWIEKD